MEVTEEVMPSVYILMEAVHTDEDPPKETVFPFRAERPDGGYTLPLWSCRSDAQAFLDDPAFELPAVVHKVKKPQFVSLLKMAVASDDFADWVIVDAPPHEEWPDDEDYRPGMSVPIEVALKLAEEEW